jgi:hypothetical protein
MTSRRSFFATLLAPLVARFAPKPTTTLTGVSGPATIKVDRISGDYPDLLNGPFLILQEEMTLGDFLKRYPPGNWGPPLSDEDKEYLMYGCAVGTGWWRNLNEQSSLESSK